MGHSPQSDAMYYFSNIWETYKHRKYIPTQKDWGAAIILLTYMIEPDDYIKRINEYLTNDKWTEFGNHSFNVFVHNINSVTPIQSSKKKRENTQETIMTIRCADCQTEHPSNEMCPKCYPKSQSTDETPEEIRKHIEEAFSRKERSE